MEYMVIVSEWNQAAYDSIPTGENCGHTHATLGEARACSRNSSIWATKGDPCLSREFPVVHTDGSALSESEDESYMAIVAEEMK